MHGGPYERLKMEAQAGLSQQRRGLGHSHGNVGWRVKRLGTRDGDAPSSEGGRGCCSAGHEETTDDVLCEETLRYSQLGAERS